MARHIRPELIDAGKSVVIVERNPEIIEELSKCGAMYVEGNAYEDETLKAAGIETASHLLALLPHDADNVYITLTARALNNNINIVARSEDFSGENKLRRAGVNDIVHPYQASGTAISQKIIRPYVSQFLEVTSGKGQTQLALEQVVVPEDSPIKGKSLLEANLRNRTGVIIAAIIAHDGTMLFSPGPEAIIEGGATMIVLGQLDSFSRLYKVLGNLD